MLAQRVFALCLGYEDLNDHDLLRCDPLLATIVGKADPTGQDRRRASDRGSALAGKSTLNRLELRSEDPERDAQYKKIGCDAEAVDRFFVERFRMLSVQETRSAPVNAAAAARRPCPRRVVGVASPEKSAGGNSSALSPDASSCAASDAAVASASSLPDGTLSSDVRAHLLELAGRALGARLAGDRATLAPLLATDFIYQSDRELTARSRTWSWNKAAYLGELRPDTTVKSHATSERGPRLLGGETALLGLVVTYTAWNGATARRAYTMTFARRHNTWLITHWTELEGSARLYREDDLTEY